jgi:hypothetical protein
MSTGDDLLPLFLLSDEPIGVSGDDGLGMNQTARVIAEAALGAATPFTVGIFGAWGHGKTSLLNAARTLLEPVKSDGTVTRPHPHVVTVQFNAWRYEKEEHPIVPLVAAIAKAVKQRLDEDETFGRAVGVIGKTIATTVYDGAMSLIGAIKLEAKGRLGSSAGAQVEGGGSVDAGGAQRNLAERQAKREKADQPRIQSWIDQSLYLSAFDDLAGLHVAAKKSGANKTGQAPVIVVFIDDLDRCRPEAAVEILEGIKLVLAQPGFVFVLALYREVIERYLDRQSEVRYGEKHRAIGEGYIDKIVQLPLWLPSHEGGFENYIRNLIDTKLSAGLLPHRRDKSNPQVAATTALLEAVKQSVPLLARLSTHSPRKLVRKINELLIDDRLLPVDAHVTIDCRPEERRAVLFPLLLIQRALLELPLPQQIKPLMENDALCAALAAYRSDLTDTTDADGNVGPMLFRDALKAKSQESGQRDTKPDTSTSASAAAGTDPAINHISVADAPRWLKATDCLVQNEYRAVLLNTTAGRAWLSNHAGRRMVTKAIATQAASARRAKHGSEESRGGFAAALAGSPVTMGIVSAPSEELRQEITIIERAVRKHLQLEPEAQLGLAEFCRVRELDLSGDPITDRGAAWLARPDSGLTALSSLDLGSTMVTNVGAAALAAKDSALVALAKLRLNDNAIDDAGAEALATKGSRLGMLSHLVLNRTGVGDEGASALVRPGTGLKALGTLFLVGTQVSRERMAALRKAHRGIRFFTSV